MISRSGVGEVHLATQLGLDRKVAVKLVSRRRDSEWPAIVKRLSHEATVLARLNHVNVVTLHDFGETESGDFFLTMEYLDGRPLDKVVEADGPLPFDTVLKIAVQIARALREAHAVGVIHRDLTAADVFLVRGADETDHSHVKVLDFGLAATGPTGPANVDDVAEPVIGSPAYTSPEQIYGEPATERSDLYSFGVILYLMLTGKPPFSGTSTAEILRSQLKDAAPPLSLMGYRRKIPRALEELTLRCLEKDPGARMPSAKDLIVALKAVFWALDPSQTVDGLPPRDRGRFGESSPSHPLAPTEESVDLPEPIPVPARAAARAAMLTPPPVSPLSPISPVPAARLQSLTPLPPPAPKAPPPSRSKLVYAAPVALLAVIGAWISFGRTDAKLEPEERPAVASVAPKAPVVPSPVVEAPKPAPIEPARPVEQARTIEPAPPVEKVRTIEPPDPIAPQRTIEPQPEGSSRPRGKRLVEKAERTDRAERASPSKVEPAKVEPAKVEPAKVEPTQKAEAPAKVEPAPKPEAPKAEPAKPEVANSEPAKVEPAKAAPVEAPAPVKAPEPKPAATKAATVVPPQPLKNVLPVYPPRYRSMGYAGSVTVKVSIDAEGTPTEVEVTEPSTYPEFDFAAKKAAMRERYSPATKDGTPIPYVRTARYNFGAPR